MRVLLLCAAPRGSRTGNRRTAERWARLFRKLGHRVRIQPGLGDAIGDAGVDVLVALHARHSAAAVRDARARFPALPIVVALTGTDLAHDIHVDRAARHSLALADRLVVLHDLATKEVPAAHRKKVRVIRQSAPALPAAVAKARRGFEVAVVGHLRDVKDPLRMALATRLLPASSRVHVVHAGRALEPRLARAATKETRANPRYRWIGDVAPARALRLIARAHLFVLTSQSEGGANVIGEAAMCGTPIVATDIPAVRAALGPSYPALFPFGDEVALARLVARAETDRRWLADLARRVRARRGLFSERKELAAWRALFSEVVRRGARAKVRVTAAAGSTRRRRAAPRA
jgi:putative glycosyltransferase (TIGR04348 family)